MDARYITMMLMLVPFASAEILFQENFEDTNFASRGWYDHLQGIVTTDEHVAGSNSAFECKFLQGERGCENGAPGRHQFDESDTVYLSYWVKYSTDYIGSGRPYHPHEFHFITNKDDRYVGPANTHLTTYTEHVGMVPMQGIQDSRNVNSGCIVRNNDPVDNCDTYDFGEDRSVASCNGPPGEFTSRDCYNSGYWYSALRWSADDVYFRDQPGPYYKNDWHFIESMWQMNTIDNGIGQVDGKVRYWYDGELLISSDNIMLRTGVNADMQFNQFLTGFYIGDGSPVDQIMWVDNMTVSTHRIGYQGMTAFCGDGNCTESCDECPEDCGECADCDDTEVCADAVFCSEFEEGNKDIWDDRDANADANNLLMSDPGPCNDPGNTVMRLRADPGRGGADLVKELPTQHDKLYARWYVKWEPGYDFSADNHGGGLHAGARNNLGRSDYRPQGNDWFSTWFEPLAGNDANLQARPNLYTYYRGMYIDCANPQGSCWGDHFPCMFSDNYCEKDEHKGMSPKLENDVWYCIEVMLDGGTPVQNDADADGVQNFWIDGVEQGPFEHLWHRTTANLKVSILWLSMWHHGEHSVEGLMLDNVVVSENRIGCLGAPPPTEQCTDADTNEDGIISTSEMGVYISNWKSGIITMYNLMNAIDKWKNGC